MKTVMLKIKKPKRFYVDFILLFAVLFLVGFGILMVYSASSYQAQLRYNDKFFFMKKQIYGAIAGFFGMITMYFIDYKKLEKFKWPLFIVSCILLLLVFVPKIGVKVYGARRWINLGFITIQPSEIAKFAIVILFSTLIAANQKLMNNWKFILFLFGVLGVTCVLVVAEPHLSATVLIAAIGVVLIYVGGLNRKVVVAGIILAVVGVALVIVTQSTGFISYGADRIKYWLDPWADATGEGFQTIQSLLAIGSGGILGRGIGMSRQKYLWVPEPHNDFIFSIVCEELGLIGAVLIILMFALLVWRGFAIAMRSSDKFGSMLAIGLTFQVGLQAMLNIWVVTNTMPNTGISLPFFSYGGTSLLILLAEMGIVLSVSRGASIEKSK